MKKLIYIFVILLTFSVGVIAFYLRPIVTPVSVGEISRNAVLYQFNEVKVKGYLQVLDSEAKSLEIYSIFDFSERHPETASLILDDVKNNEELSKLIDELARKNDEIGGRDFENGKFVAEIEVIGNIEEIKSCFGLPYVLKAKEVRQISPIRFISNEEIQEMRKKIKNLE